MALSDVWARTLVYFGIAEEEDWDEDGYLTEEELAEASDANVRRLAGAALAARLRRRLDRSRARRRSGRASSARARRSAPCATSSRCKHPARPASTSILPRSFNDAQQVADRFKDGVPVILNLQSADSELSKRLIDFASGLTYALDGGMQRIADKVFLLTPRDVELSAEDRARMLERGFFNQA